MSNLKEITNDSECEEVVMTDLIIHRYEGDRDNLADPFSDRFKEWLKKEIPIEDSGYNNFIIKDNYLDEFLSDHVYPNGFEVDIFYHEGILDDGRPYLAIGYEDDIDE